MRAMSQGCEARLRRSTRPSPKATARDAARRRYASTIDVSQWERLERSYVIGRNISRAFLEAQEEAFAK
jgi:hypothetical protein